MSDTSKKLREALNLLGPNGENWGQLSSYDGFGRRCMGGAIEAVGKPDSSKLWDALLEFLPEGAALTSWNDRPERTFTEVREVFEKAIRASEEPNAD